MNPTVSESNHKALLKNALLALDEMQARLDAATRARRAPIAIVGMGCRFPGGANDPDAYWQLLLHGVDAVRELPEERWPKEQFADPDLPVAWYGGFLDGIDQFDPQFFGISPREAASMDPQQRLVLEVGWEALESAGQAPDRLVGSQTGVFLGITTNDYGFLLRQAGSAQMDAYAATGSALNAAAGRLAFTLGLQGPTLAVDTACSSSLVAVHLACQSLRNGECNMALAGGVNATLTADAFISFARWGMMAPDGRCKTFDADANGFVRGEGCGMIVLKRLDDAIAQGDRILAVIRGSAVNQDGRSSGLTVPNGPAQQAVLRKALADAGVQPADISYVETHGTGTALGDPIEVEALGAVLGEGRSGDQPLVIGSVKTNLGHLESAAGVASLIKLVLSLQHETIPPHLHFQQRNPRIPWPAFPVEIPKQPMPWLRSRGVRRAGISGFGFSGTNAHLILEEAPIPASAAGAVERPLHMVIASAPHAGGLAALADRHAQHIGTHPELSLPDMAYTLNTGRGQFAHRLAVAAADSRALQAQLSAFAAGERSEGIHSGSVARSERPRVAFLFTGQGSQYVGMGGELYATQPTFRRALDECAALLDGQLDRPLLSVVFGAEAEAQLLDDTTYTQPALFAVEYALATLWQAWGVRPSAVLGHSIGEYVAACVAGVMSLADALRLVAARGRLMGALAQDGAMVSLQADEVRVRQALAPYAGEVSIAAVNGPASVVISGRREAVLAISTQLAAEGVKTQRLSVSHAFHSPLMEPMLAAFAEVAASITYHKPTLRLVSNVTGKLAGDEVTRPEYWVRHVRHAVRFADGVATLQAEGAGILLEIGPKPVLLGMAGQSVAGDREVALLPSLRQGQSDWQQMLSSLGELYVRGVEIDWAGFDGDYARRKLALPTYPFQRQRYWVEAPQQKRAAASVRPLIDKITKLPLHAETVFEAEFSVAALPFLAEHQVYGTVIAPGACQLAMALNAAELSLGQNKVLQLEDVVLPQALVLGAEQVRTVQAAFHAGQVSGASAAGSGTKQEFRIVSFCARQGVGVDDTVEGADMDVATHATGYAAATAGATGQPPAAVDLRGLQQRCRREVDVAGFYADSAAAQIELGPSFRWLAEAWQGGENAAPEAPEALARLVRPAAVESLGDYVLHPGLLDACFQVTGVTGEVNGETLLPFALESLQLYRPARGEVWWCHATQTGRHKWDIQLLDEEGEVVTLMRGFQVRAAPAAAIRGDDIWRQWLYSATWQARPYFGLPLDYLPDPAALVAELQKRALPLAQEQDAGNEHALRSVLEALSIAYVLAAFDKAGFRWQAGALWRSEQIARQVGVIPSYRRLLERLLGMVEESGIIQREQEGWRVLYSPAVAEPAAQLSTLQALYGNAPELRLLARCGVKLGEVLRGVQEPLELLFPGGDATDVTQLYTKSPGAQAVSGLAQTILARLPAGRGLRILEVGAGAGDTTAGLLPLLPHAQVEYIFTDNDAAYLNKAQARFGNHAFVHYQALDIEQPPLDQGFAPAQADLVLAANVLHATRNLGETLTHVRQLLQPGGQLVLLESTAPDRWTDLTFGLAEGWWRFADQRQMHPLLTAEEWKSLLLGNGFRLVDCIEQGGQAVIVAQADNMPVAVVPGGRWVILADERGIGAGLALRLRQEGAEVVLVHAGEGWRQVDENTVYVAADCAEDYRRLVSSLPGLHGVVHLWSLGDTPDLAQSVRHSCDTALLLVQALLQEQVAPAGLWLVTQDAQAAVAGDLVSGVAQSGLWGMGKVIALEHPELNPVCIDLARMDQLAADNNMSLAAQLYAEVTSVGPQATAERQVALRPDARYVARLQRYAAAAGQTGLTMPEGPYRLEVSERGMLDNLQLRPVTRRAPAGGEVEIQVQAGGMNFRDVLNVLGAYPGDPGPIGSECAGVVVAVGEGVTHFAPGDSVLAMTAGSFSRYVTVNSAHVAHRPATLTVVEAAALPTAYLTAYYGLHQLAQMKAGERVLIHAAAGGVGMAAVQLAQQAGAEVFATASPGKWEVLRAMGVNHIYNSRTVDFAAQILADTGGCGVDVILNSLTGPGFMEANLAVLAADGYLAEMSKRNIWSAEQVAGVRADVRYTVFDLGEISVQQPELWQQMLAAVMLLLAEGQVKPLPCTVFPLQEAVQAFRLMQQARHVGKIVLTLPAGEGETELAIRQDGTYLITGGLGGLGLAVAEWLAERGARHLLLLGRRVPTAAVQLQLDALAAQGVTVTVAQADVADVGQLKAAMQQVNEHYPLCGVIHGAGVLDDGALQQQNSARFAKVLAPKVQGAWNLHLLTQGMALDFFVLFSSAAALLGSRGQANYAAANAFLDALAHHRHAQGLPGLSIDWGAWAEVGMAAQLVRTQRTQLAAQGMRAIAPAQGVAALAHLLGQPTPQVGVIPVNWATVMDNGAFSNPFFAAFRTQALTAAQHAVNVTSHTIRQQLALATPDQAHRLLLSYVQREVAQALQMQDLPAAQAGFNELGMDSLTTIDLRRRLEKGLQTTLPSTIAFEYPTVEALAAYLASVLVVMPQASDSVHDQKQEPAADPAGQALGDLSEAELDDLLEQELAFLKEE